MSLKSRKPGATVIPIILSSDKTQLTQFRDNMAYPIYLTIGNIPKEIRRKPSRHAQVLMGYIPTTKLLGITNKSARARALGNLFHACMQHLLAPINSIGESGVKMMSSDGIWRWCHPILAVYVGDYPEQTLVTCTFKDRCPKCTVPSHCLGDYNHFPLRDFDNAADVYLLANSDAHVFHAACREAGLKPVYHPFWESLPLANIYVSITPDVLHQLLQGVVKHLISWLTDPLVFGPEAIDARCRSLPPNHHIRLFPKGITTLSRVTGTEHKDICRILIGLTINLPLPGRQLPACVVKAVRTVLDFLYLAQFHSHTSNTLEYLDNSLARFHHNKHIFADLGVRKHFNLPKIHSLIHYRTSIALFGTADNYNTEQSERLHIDFAKDAYRATNRRDQYPQMTTWLEHREKVHQHSVRINRRKQALDHRDVPRAPAASPIGPPCVGTHSLKMSVKPSVRGVSFDELGRQYGAVGFQNAMAKFIAHVNHPRVTGTALQAHADNTLIPFHSVSAFHKVKFTSTSSNSSKPKIVDAIHVRPEQRDSSGRVVPPRFDTVLVRGKNSDLKSMHGPNGKCNCIQMGLN